MKTLIVGVLGVGVVAGVVYWVNRPKAVVEAPAEVVVEAVSAPATEPVVKREPMVVVHNSSNPANTAVAQAPSQTQSIQPTQPTPSRELAQAQLDTTMVNQTVEFLMSPQVGYGQKQAAWKQLLDKGKMDQAIGELERGMAANPQSAEYPAALGQAYFKKCATLKDTREQGLLALQADKLFDAALAIDPGNWEARFNKAVGLSYWPASMNKGEEVIQHFGTLIEQQEAQAPQAHFADSYVLLGNQYEKAGRGDYARMVWERGAGLFPNDERLKQKLAAGLAARGQ